MVAFPYLVDTLGLSAVALLVPTSLPLGLRFGGHLTLLVLLAVSLTFRLLPYTDGLWFGAGSLTRVRRVMATGLGAIVIVTGIVGLVTLASSAALRYQPSTQFLQLLSALDIAWAVSTTMIAVHWLRGRRAALVAGGVVGVLCIASIGRYLDSVGFTPLGRWRLDAGALWEFVLPYDIAVATVAIVLFVVAARRKAVEDN